MDKASVQRILERHERRQSNQPDGQRAVFTREDLQGFHFAGRDLTGMHFIACDLRGADFQGCNLSFAQFTCCDLRTADLRHVQAAGVSFVGSDLRKADMRSAFTGIGSSFSAADLRGAQMEGAHFKKTDFHNAWMDAADLKGVRFEEAFAPSWKPIDGSLNSRLSGAALAEKLQRKPPPPEMANSPVVLAYEQGSGPALLDRLEAAERVEAVAAQEGKLSLADLKDQGQGMQPDRQTNRVTDLELHDLLESSAKSEADRSGAKPDEGKFSLDDLRREPQQQAEPGEDQRSRLRDDER